MKRILPIFFVAALFPGISLRSQEKDSVFLYNGQVLIGEIKYAALGVLQIDDRDLKLQKVKMYKIKRLNATGRFKVETMHRQIHYGRVRAIEREGWVEVEREDSVPVKMEIIEIGILLALEKEFLKRLNGSLSAGLNYTKSSGVGLVNISVSAQYAARKWEFQATGAENASLDSSGFSRDVESFQLFSNYNLNATYFAAGLLQYQRNLELSISRRYQQMLGGGSKLFVKRNWQLMAITGLAFNQERSTDGVESPLLLEIPLMLRFNFFKFHHPNIQINSYQTAYFSLSEKGRVRVDTNTDFSWQLIRYFYFTVNPYSNFDSKPPAGSNTFDFGLVIGLSYKF